MTRKLFELSLVLGNTLVSELVNFPLLSSKYLQHFFEILRVFIEGKNGVYRVIIMLLFNILVINCSFYK